MLVKDIMTHNVVSGAKGRTIDVKNHISDLPILLDKNGKLVGIVTEADVFEFIVGPERPAEKCKAEVIMTPDPYTVKEEDSLDHLVEEIQRRRIKRLPVIRRTNGRYCQWHQPDCSGSLADPLHRASADPMARSVI